MTAQYRRYSGFLRMGSEMRIAPYFPLGPSFSWVSAQKSGARLFNLPPDKFFSFILGKTSPLSFEAKRTYFIVFSYRIAACSFETCR